MSGEAMKRILPCFGYARRVPRLPWLLAGLVPLLLAAIYDAATHQGATRLALQGALAVAVGCMHRRLSPAPALDGDAERAVVVALRVLAAALVALALALGVEHILWSARHNNIRLDIGQSSYRAVLVLR